jgi:hypothetical protein
MKKLYRYARQASSNGTEDQSPHLVKQLHKTAEAKPFTGLPELGWKIREAETADLRIELLGLLHVADVTGVCDDC